MKNRFEYLTRKLFLDLKKESSEEKIPVTIDVRSEQYINELTNAWNKGVLKTTRIGQAETGGDVKAKYAYCVIPTLSERNDTWNRALLSRRSLSENSIKNPDKKPA